MGAKVELLRIDGGGWVAERESACAMWGAARRAAYNEVRAKQERESVCRLLGASAARAEPRRFRRDSKMAT